MSVQWINGIKPTGVADESILVIGPEDFDDEVRFKSILDGYTLRLEAVRVIINTGGNCGAFRPKGFSYKGVSKYAYEWASKNFWPIELHQVTWWKGKHHLMNQEIIRKLIINGKRRAHCIAFWERKDRVTSELMEMAREVVSIKNFKLVRI